MTKQDVPFYVAAIIQNPEWLKSVAHNNGQLSPGHVCELSRTVIALSVAELEESLLRVCQD